MSEDEGVIVSNAEPQEKELSWAARIMVDSLRKQGWLAAIERRAARADELEQVVAKTAGQIDALQADVERLRHEAREKESAYQQALVKHQQQVGASEAMLRDRASEIALLREGAERDKAQMSERIDKVAAELDSRGRALASAAAVRNKLDERLRTAEAAVATFQREMVGHAATVVALQASLADCEKELARATADLEASKSLLEAAQSNAALTKEELERRLEERAAATAQEKAKLQRRLDEVVTRAAHEKAEAQRRFDEVVTRAAHEKAEAQRKLDEVVQKAAGEKSDLQRKLEDAATKASGEVADLQRTCQERAARVAERDELVRVLSSAVKARDERIVQLEEELVRGLAGKVSEEPLSEDEERAKLVAELDERDALVAELEGALAVQRTALAKRDALLAELLPSGVASS